MNLHINLKKATLFSICAALSLSVMSLFVKLAAPHTNSNMTLLFRFGVSFFYILTILIVKKSKKLYFPIKTPHLKLHLLRAIVSIITMLLFYYSLAHIHLLNANLLLMTNPLFIPVFALLFFHKKTNWKSWLTIIVAFIGITMVIKPGGELFNSASLIALASGITAALAILVIRLLSTCEHHHTCMLYYFPLAFLVSIIVAMFHWQTPNLHTILLLLLVGGFGTAYQEFLIRASQHAQARIVSTLLYTSIVFSGLLGWQVWGEIPNLISWIGIILVCLGSILTISFTRK